jgi:hypothetical protein
MIKHLGLLMRKTGMTRDAFVKRYETGHVPLVNELLAADFAAYNRCYPVDVADDRDVGFDAMTQIWYVDQAAEDASIALLSIPDVGRRISEDEVHAFERAKLFFFKVEDRTTGSPPGPVKAVGISKPLDVARDEMIKRMENTFVPQLTGLGGLARCTRNYPIPDSAFQHQNYDRHSRRPPSLITELWFANTKDLAAWQTGLRELKAGAKDLGDYLGEVVEVQHFGDQPLT